MLALTDALAELGYRHLEVVPSDPRWIALVDAKGQAGRAFVVQASDSISSEILRQVDATTAELSLAFIVVIHGQVAHEHLELLSTWDYSCPCSVISLEELERSRQEDEQTDVHPENPAEFLKRPGESHLSLLERLRPRLLDLTLRNPLLNFRSRGSRAVPIIDELPRLVLSSLLNGGPMRLDAAQDNVTDGSITKPTQQQITVTVSDDDLPVQMTLEPESDDFELPADPGKGPVAARHRDQALQTPFKHATLDSRLSAIFRDQETAIESTGTNPLYLAMGFLHWYESPEESKPRHAPLLLVPVTIARNEVTVAVPLRRGDEGWDPDGPALQRKKVREFQYEITMSGEEIIANECLVRKMANDFQLVIPRLGEDIEEGKAVEPEAYFRQVASIIARLKTDKRWKVRREIALGFFSFVKLQEWQDLDPANWTTDPNGLLERMLSAKVQEPKNRQAEDVQADDFHLTSPVPVVNEADNTQTAVLARAIAGEDLVVQGPPGTGKTQTITNLIACMLGAGKRVLFVAEKLAALNAAQEKLAQAGLAEFCLELHSHKATPAAALKALHLRRQRNQIPAVDLEGHRRNLRPLRDALNDYASLIATQHGHKDDRLEQILWRSEVAKLALQECVADQIEPPRLALDHGYLMDAQEYLEAQAILNGIAELAHENIPSRALPWHDFRTPAVWAHAVRSILDAVGQMAENVAAVLALRSQAADCPIWSLPIAEWLVVADRLAGMTDRPTSYLSFVVPAARMPKRAVLDAFITTIGLLKTKRSLAENIIVQLPESADYTAVSAAAAALITRDQSLASKEILRSLLTASEQVRDAITSVTQVLPVYLGRLGVSAKLTWRHLPVVLRLVRAQQKPAATTGLHPRLLRAATRAAIESGKNTNDALVALRTDLNRDLVVEDLPRDDDLRTLRQTFRARPHLFLACFGIGPLAHARRRIKGVLRSPQASGKLDLPVLLDRALEWRQRERAFIEDHNLITEVGPAFAGTKTPWPPLIDATELVDALTVLYGVDQARSAIEHVTTASGDDLSLIESALADLIALRDQNSVAWAVVPVAALTPIGDLSAVTEDLHALIAQLRIVLNCYGERIGMPLESRPLLDVAAAISEVVSIQALGRSLDENQDARALLGSSFSGATTNILPVQETLGWVDHLVNAQLGALTEWILADGTPQRLTTARTVLSAAHREWDSALSAALRLSSYGSSSSGGLFDLRSSPLTPDHLAQGLTKAIAAGDHLQGWTRWCSLAGHGEPLGLKAIIMAVQLGQMTPAGLAHALDADVYGRLARQALADHPQLKAFDRSTFDATRESFRDCDRRMIDIGRKHVARHLLGMKPPQGHSGTRVADLTELRLIDWEVKKSKAHVPIRQLVHRAGDALLTLAPCLMMSPLSVAQFLPRIRGMFDLVIMDEASQIRPEDAFGALLRAKQAVVVGDEKQMPPSYLFDSLGSNAEGQTLLAGNACSVLDLAHTAFPHGRARLKWHYRSHHESLIQFSNARYYDNELVIFPSRSINDEQLGLTFVHVPDGRFETGLNKVEAEVVVAAIIDHALKMKVRKPELRESLLVVVMNAEQCKLVRDLIDTACLRDQGTGDAIQALSEIPERLMIKNLENVQGDERDRVIIGFTYGKDPQSGVVRQSFGPVSQQGGERRLNVLFSRAKRRITVISSMRSNDLKPGIRSGRGVHDLKDYLAFAETGGIPDRGKVSRREPDSDFERAVGAVISHLGFTPVYQVGVANYFIDIGVLDPSSPTEYVIGIECDGATYHSSRCARDRDRLRQDIIESRGWRIHRIWSTSWFRDRFSEERRLQQAIQTAIKRQSA